MANALSKLTRPEPACLLPRSHPVPAATFTGLAATADLAWFAFKCLPVYLNAEHVCDADSALLQKGSSYQRYTTASGIVYPRIRTFFYGSEQAKKLDRDLPLLVFTHGPGGSMAQFVRLLAAFSGMAMCLAIDLPGCGLSDFQPRKTEAYTATAFADLLDAAIDRHRDKGREQPVILVGHSMGCSINALLTNHPDGALRLSSHAVRAMIAISPRANPPSDEDLLHAQRMSYLPPILFDALRMFDRRGGTDRVTVARVIGEDEALEKNFQLRFDQRSKSPMVQTFTAAAVHQELDRKNQDKTSVLGVHLWERVNVPLFLVAAKNDTLASPSEVDLIVDWLTLDPPREVITPPPFPSPPPPSITGEGPPLDDDHGDNVMQQFYRDGRFDILASIIRDRAAARPVHGRKVPGREMPVDPSQCVHLQKTHSMYWEPLETSIFPEPTALLNHHGAIVTLLDLMETFVATHVDPRLSRSWQLNHIQAMGQWDVKNVEKWKRTETISKPIGGIFRAAKTMREVDLCHNPEAFAACYSYKFFPRGVAFVVDLTFHPPAYNSYNFAHTGIGHRKLMTVSNTPPTRDEVDVFIAIVNHVRSTLPDPRATIAVHCHYGFNRTGFLIIAYLVQVEHWTLDAALAEFTAKRPPGIKQAPLVRELRARYPRANPAWWGPARFSPEPPWPRARSCSA